MWGCVDVPEDVFELAAVFSLCREAFVLEIRSTYPLTLA